MEDMIHMGQLKDEIKQEVQKIVSEMKLVEEDIKGAMVDKSIQKIYYMSYKLGQIKSE